MAINGRTKVTGIFGWPVEHSLSPAMHNAAFERLGLEYIYVPFPVRPEDLGRAVAAVRALDLTGVNITIPHKSAVIPFLDELTPEAQLIGAVNTIVHREGRLQGYNTDAPGFLKALEVEAGINPQGKRIFIIGAGGAARAVSLQLALAGAGEITFTTPFPQEVVSLREAIGKSSKAGVREAPWDENVMTGFLGEIDLLINTTPLGMYPNLDDLPPVCLTALPPGALVCDLIYNPRETLFLRRARELGFPVLNGMGMLVYQGAIAFELWTGRRPPLDVMRAALEAALNK